MAAGYFSSLVLKTDGTVWAAGANSIGELGDGTSTARPSRVGIDY
jgi:alpha-tubulin suppressor-like RCC1 family protein